MMSSLKMDIVQALQYHLNAQDCLWQQRKRVLNSFALFCIFAAKQGRKHSVFEALETLFHQVVPPPYASTTSPAAVCRALQKLPIQTFSTVNTDMLHEMSNRPFLRHLRPPGKPLCLAVDGCKMRVPPNMAAHGFTGMWHANGAGPHLLLTAVVDVSTDLIVAYDISPSLNERAALCRLVCQGSIPPGSILLADRGYFSFQTWRCLEEHDINMVFRVKRTACKEVGQALKNPHRQQRISINTQIAQLTLWSSTGDHQLTGRVPQTLPPRCSMVAHKNRQLRRPMHPNEWVLLSNMALSPHSVCYVVEGGDSVPHFTDRVRGRARTWQSPLHHTQCQRSMPLTHHVPPVRIGTEMDSMEETRAQNESCTSLESLQHPPQSTTCQVPWHMPPQLQTFRPVHV